MKRIFIALIALTSFYGAQADVIIDLSVGQLLESDGTTPVPDGGLIQILANTSGTGVSTFDAPTTTSFTGTSGNDVVVASFSLDSTGVGTSGDFSVELSTTATGNQIQLNLGGVSTGDDLLIRWYPTLTASSSQPGAGTSYGQFRTDTLPDGSTIAWAVPASSASPYTLSFLTTSQSGSQPNSAGIANLTVVPEPSTLALMAVSGLGLFGFYLRARRRSFSC